jgi:hypothetical protein
MGQLGGKPADLGDVGHPHRCLTRARGLDSTVTAELPPAAPCAPELQRLTICEHLPYCQDDAEIAPLAQGSQVLAMTWDVCVLARAGPSLTEPTKSR